MYNAVYKELTHSMKELTNKSMDSLFGYSIPEPSGLSKRGAIGPGLTEH
jgi:hypothetical protein